MISVGWSLAVARIGVAAAAPGQEPRRRLRRAVRARAADRGRCVVAAVGARRRVGAPARAPAARRGRARRWRCAGAAPVGGRGGRAGAAEAAGPGSAARRRGLRRRRRGGRAARSAAAPAIGRSTLRLIARPQLGQKRSSLLWIAAQRGQAVMPASRSTVTGWRSASAASSARSSASMCAERARAWRARARRCAGRSGAGCRRGRRGRGRRARAPCAGSARAGARARARRSRGWARPAPGGSGGCVVRLAGLPGGASAGVVPDI